MKKIIALFIATSILVSCQNAKTDKTKETETVDKKEIGAVKSTTGFSVKSPVGWERSDTTYMGQTVTFIRHPRENNQDQFMENANIVTEKLGTLDTDNYLEVSVKNMENGLTNFTHEPVQDVKMGDYDFKKIRYSHTYSGIDIDAEVYFYFKDKVAYLITCSTLKGEREKYETSFEEIVHSFRID